MRSKFKIKVTMTWPDDEGVLRVLNRKLEEVIYESDHRHADGLVEELELKKGQVVAPAMRDSRKARKKDEESAGSSVAGEGAQPCAGARQIGAGEEAQSYAGAGQTGAGMGRGP